MILCYHQQYQKELIYGVDLNNFNKKFSINIYFYFIYFDYYF